MNTIMKILLHYIQNEPFYIRAEKLLERKFTGCNVPEGFQLCSIIRGFFILMSLIRRLNTSRFGGARLRHLRFGFLCLMQFRSLV